MKDTLGQNHSPFPHAAGRQGPGWWAPSQAPFPSQWDLATQNIPNRAYDRLQGDKWCLHGSSGMLDRALSSHSHLPTGATGLQAYFPPFLGPEKGLRSWEPSSPQIQTRYPELGGVTPVPANCEVGKEGCSQGRTALAVPEER